MNRKRVLSLNCLFMMRNCLANNSTIISQHNFFFNDYFYTFVVVLKIPLVVGS